MKILKNIIFTFQILLEIVLLIGIIYSLYYYDNSILNMITLYTLSLFYFLNLWNALYLRYMYWYRYCPTCDKFGWTTIDENNNTYCEHCSRIIK